MIFIGISGLVLPVIPGILFLILGILVLSIDLPLIERMLNRIELRYPQAGKTIRKLRSIIIKRDDDKGSVSR
ncbi:MAG: hypothetical protein M1438_00755 [Deltaproteobacteria bacterium]|nr:hypothetical protein [Deltaproteobacteria bacterium]